MLVEAGTRGIGTWASRRAHLSGERIALIDGDRRITYAELTGGQTSSRERYGT
jgi:non-ribosomal peptide synthetase component E (peptide arylation enzyme)